MSETVHRLIAMLSMIPRAPRKTTVKDLCDRLQESGFRINNRRMVERDLINLSVSQHFPITCDGHKPAGWSWVAGAQAIDIPSMDPHTALTFMLARTFLDPVLPRSTLRFLDPHFARAQEILESRRIRKLSDWPRKVQVLPKGLQLITPEIPEAVIETVYTALLEERRFIAGYRRPGADETKQYQVDPLGVVYRDGQVYLVCRVSGREQPIQLLLHRLRSAELLDEPCQVPPDFDLATYVKEGGFSYGAAGDPVRLRARFARGAAMHLRETPLSADQRITEADENHVIVEATVTVDWPLEWWLLGFGDQVVVLDPPALRARFRSIATQLAAAYADAAPTSSVDELELG